VTERPFVFDMGERQTWGNRISWSDFEKRQLDGHTTPRPRIGDEIRAPMASGRTARFRVVDARYPHDPPDMWFATVEDIDYVDEHSPPVTRFGVFGNAL
jgi:hypothetical protein